MAVTWQDLRDFINASDSDQAALERALANAEADLEPWLAQAYREVPEVKSDEWTLEIGQAYFKRNQTPSGQYATAEGVVNVPRDPMAYTLSQVRRYVGWL
jgi:hypothetical protein